MDEYTLVAWDDDDDLDGNVRHVAEHDLTKEEVESVLLNPAATNDVSRTTGRPMVCGETYTGRTIFVVYEVECDDPMVVRPITAYEVDWAP